MEEKINLDEMNKQLAKMADELQTFYHNEMYKELYFAQIELSYKNFKEFEEKSQIVLKYYSALSHLQAASRSLNEAISKGITIRY